MDVPTIRELSNFFDKYLRPGIKNKKKIVRYEANKVMYLTQAQENLANIHYTIKNYNIFLVREPKERIIMSLNVVDKLCNHYFTRNVLIPVTEPLLDDRNVATREGRGSKYGVKLIRKGMTYYKNRYGKNFYYLKIDIRKYFYNISHKKLKELLRPLLEDDDFVRVCNIIDSTNEPYINQGISKLKSNSDLPSYEYGKGLGIGNLSSQCLSVFYLHKLDHYIVHDLHLKQYVRYMDDLIIFHNDKEYLKSCLEKITKILREDYELEINTKKTKIDKISSGVIFLGNKFMLNKNNRIIMILRQATYLNFKKRMKYINYLYTHNLISFEKYFCSVSNYYYSFNSSITKVRNYIDRLPT